MLLQIAKLHSFLCWVICAAIHGVTKSQTQLSDWTELNWIFHHVYIYTHTHHIIFNHSSADGHLGCFHVLAIVNSTAINTGVRVSFLIIVFSGYMPRNGIAGSYGSSIFSFLRKTTILCCTLSVRFLTVGGASCYVIGGLIERSRRQGTKGSLKPTASEELRPSTQQPVRAESWR